MNYDLHKYILYVSHWDNVWKSRGCIVVNGVPMEVPRPRDFPRDSIQHDTPKAFPHIFILSSSQTSEEGFLFPMVSLGTPLVSPLVELNPNMLVRDVESFTGK